MSRYLAPALLALCLPACSPATVTRTGETPSPQIAEDLPSLIDDLEYVPIRGAQFIEIPGSPVGLPVSDEWEWKDYRIDIVAPWHDLPWGEKGTIFTLAAFAIWKADRLVYSRVSDSSTFSIGDWLTGVPCARLTDLDENGRRELEVVEWSSGMHSHKIFWMCELEPEFRLAEVLDGASDSNPGFEHVAGEAGPVFVTSDRSFDGWRTAFCDEERIPILLRRVGSEWFAAPDLMTKPAPTRAEIDELEKAARPAFESDWLSGEPCNSILRHEMLDLIAAGQEPLAWKLLAAVWPTELPGKELFEKEFRELLDRGRYWKALRSPGHLLDSAPPEGLSR